MRHSYLPGLVFPLLFTSSLYCQAMPSGGTVTSTNTGSEAASVTVDVVVIKDGSAVTGLHQQDFAISDKGKQQVITSFTEYLGESRTPAPLSNADAAKSAAGPLPGSLNLLLLDSLNSPIATKANIQAEGVHYLRKMRAGPRLAVFTLSSSLGEVQGFSADPRLMQAALARVSALPGTPQGLKVQSQVEVDRTSLKKRTEEEPPSPEMNYSIAALQHFMAQANATKIDVRTDLTLTQLQRLAQALSTIPGRKNVMWFSQSFPLTLVPSQSTFNASKDHLAEVRKVANQLATARVALYPIQTRGSRSPTTYGSQRNTTSLTTKEVDQNRLSDLMDDNEQHLEDSKAFENLADATGGKVYYDTHGLDGAVAAAMEHGQHFYTLTYTPTNKTMNGEYRPVVVKTLHGRYELSYRHGYYAQP